jgi:hypothetical protein
LAWSSFFNILLQPRCESGAQIICQGLLNLLM